MLSQLESNGVELKMLRAAVDAFKIIEEDSGYRCQVLDIDLKKCQSELAGIKEHYEDTIKALHLKLNRL
jgi:hypothetical protein